MYVKWIRCGVKAAHKAAFEADQMAWAPLLEVQGFVGQVGGWRTGEEAVVLGFWSSLEAHTRFMQTDHDRILATAQSAPLEQMDIALWEAALPLPGRTRVLSDAMAEATFISIIETAPDDDHSALMGFTELHAELAQLDTHLGSVAVRREAPLSYRVISFWEGPAPALDPRWSSAALPLAPKWTFVAGE